MGLLVRIFLGILIVGCVLLRFLEGCFGVLFLAVVVYCWWFDVLACCAGLLLFLLVALTSYLLLLRVLFACHPWRVSMPFHGTTNHFSKDEK